MSKFPKTTLQSRRSDDEGAMLSFLPYSDMWTLLIHVLASSALRPHLVPCPPLRGASPLANEAVTLTPDDLGINVRKLTMS